MAWRKLRDPKISFHIVCASVVVVGGTWLHVLGPFRFLNACPGVRSIGSLANRIHVGGDLSPRFAAADHKHSRCVGEPIYRPTQLVTYLATELSNLHGLTASTSVEAILF